MERFKQFITETASKPMSKTAEQWVSYLTSVVSETDTFDVPVSTANKICQLLDNHPKFESYDADKHEPQADLHYYTVNGRDIAVVFGKGRGNRVASVNASPQE